MALGSLLNILRGNLSQSPQGTSVLERGLPVLSSPSGLNNPGQISGLQAYYDFTNTSSLKVDSSNYVSYASDLSGNSPVNVLALPGTTNNYASSPDSSALSTFTNSIDIIVKASATDWTNSNDYLNFVSKWSSVGQNSFYFAIRSTGVLSYRWSADGGVGTLVDSTASVSFADYSIGWVRVTHTFNEGGNNVVRFYTSTNGTSWSQLGADVSTAGTTSIFDGTYNLQIGCRDYGASGSFSGNIYRVQIYNGINGTLVFDANFATATRGASSFTESSSNAATVTINTSGDLGARICGERDLAQLTGAKQPLLLPWSGTNYLWLPGVTGNYVSTPDSTATSLTGDWDLRIQVAMDNWAAGSSDFFCKWGAASGTYSYLIRANNSNLDFYYSIDGTGIGNISRAFSFSNYSTQWIRITRVKSSGLTTCYSSTDGVTWTQLGATAIVYAGNDLYDNAQALFIGARDPGTSELVAGKIYRAQIYSGINGTLVADFDPSRAANNATSFTASTGETWTINSTAIANPAQIVGKQSLLFDGSNDFLSTALFAVPIPFTAVIIGRQNTWGTSPQRSILSSAKTGDLNYLLQWNVTPQINTYSGGGPSLSVNNGDWALNTNAVVFWLLNSAGTTSLRVNRLAATSGNNSTNSFNGLTLAAYESSSRQAPIQVMQVLIYNRALTTNELDKLAVYYGQQDAINV